VNVSHDEAVSQQGHYAGAVTRLVAFLVDQAIATAVFSAMSAFVVFLVSLLTDLEVDTNVSQIVIGVLYAVWLFMYYAYSWSVTGKTPGMAIFGIRVVQGNGAQTTPKHGVTRTLAFSLSFMTLGLGFLGIVVGRRHRALHDVIADTAVVYAWDARGARWRFLARRQAREASADVSDAPPQRSAEAVGT